MVGCYCSEFVRFLQVKGEQRGNFSTKETFCLDNRISLVIK